MPVDKSFIGREYPPTPPYEVGREKIREFADAMKDPNPVYRDVEAARKLGHDDIVAPPTFAIVLTLRAGGQVTNDPDLAIDYSRVVHGEQRFTHHRPIRAGDRLVATTTIDAARSMAGNDLLTARVELATEDGDPVCTSTSMLVARGAS